MSAFSCDLLICSTVAVDRAVSVRRKRGVVCGAVKKPRKARAADVAHVGVYPSGGRVQQSLCAAGTATVKLQWVLYFALMVATCWWWQTSWGCLGAVGWQTVTVLLLSTLKRCPVRTSTNNDWWQANNSARVEACKLTIVQHRMGWQSINMTLVNGTVRTGQDNHSTFTCLSFCLLPGWQCLPSTQLLQTAQGGSLARRGEGDHRRLAIMRNG